MSAHPPTVFAVVSPEFPVAYENPSVWAYLGGLGGRI